MIFFFPAILALLITKQIQKHQILSNRNSLFFGLSNSTSFCCISFFSKNEGATYKLQNIDQTFVQIHFLAQKYLFSQIFILLSCKEIVYYNRTILIWHSKIYMNNNNTTWTDFQCLHPQVIQALTTNGLNKPTNIQTEVFQCYQHYYDFLVAAQTGSGKTLAFAAPILSQLQRLKQNLNLPRLPQCIIGLILTPTRQLAQQIESNISFALSKINESKNPIDQIKVACIIGGMSKEKQLRILSQRKPQIIIGTPGRLHELLEEQVLSFEHLKYLVIDQADRMVEMGHFKQIDEILEKIFEPKLQEFYDKDFQQITRKLDEKAKAQNIEFFVKQGGKKVKLNFNINSLATQKLFEIPSHLITFANPQQNLQLPKSKKNKKQIKAVKPQKQQSKEKVVLLEQQKLFLSKLKRRIFFISATLTRQFKGTKYYVKKSRTEEQWKQKKQERKDKRKQKQKQLFNQKSGKKDQKGDEKKQQSLEESIPKLKALLSRAKFSDKPKIIDQSSLLFLPQGLAEYICFTEGDIERTTLVISYLQNLPLGSKVIIFGNTIKVCKRIQFFVESFGFQAVNLHSHLQQKQRLKKLQKFKKSTLCNILIATDVAARGLDFTISHVIQVGVPVNGDTYVHRAGRTARANRKGEALILVDKKQINRWTQINDIISETDPNRKVHKFQPTQIQIEELTEKVQQFDWIRRNKQIEMEQAQQHDQMDAEQLGVGIQEEAPRKKYDLDKEEEAMVRHQVKKRVESIRYEAKKIQRQQAHTNWRKNKLVLSLDQIRKML